MADRRIYKVIFRNNDHLFEVFTTGVAQSSMFGFVELEALRFGERSQVVVDPTEEQIKNEFKGVKRIFVPLHAVIRIDEVEKEGVNRVSGKIEAGEVTPFPSLIPTPPAGRPGK